MSRSQNFTLKEIHTLLTCLENMKGLIMPDVVPGYRTPEEQRKGWEYITSILNSGDAEKSSKTVRSKWFDLKYRAKEKLTTHNRQVRMGLETPKISLSDIEERVLKLIGKLSSGRTSFSALTKEEMSDDADDADCIQFTFSNESCTELDSDRQHVTSSEVIQEDVKRLTPNEGFKTKNTYDKARAKLKLAKDTSNLDTDDGSKRTKRRCFVRRKCGCSDSSSSENEEQRSVSKKQRKLAPLPKIIHSFTLDNGDESQQFMHLNDSTKLSIDYASSPNMHQYIENIYSTDSSNDCQQPRKAVSSLPGMSSGISPKSTHWSRFHNATPAEKHLFRMLDDIKKVQNEHTSMLKNLINLCSSQNHATDTSSSSVIVPSLPLKSSSDLEEWEAFLDDPTNFKQALQHVADKGGLNVKEATRRILSFIFTHDLACQLNWAGRGDKTAFKEMKTKILVVYAVKESKAIKNVNEREVEDVIKNWLKYAPLRVKYREEKMIQDK